MLAPIRQLPGNPFEPSASSRDVVAAPDRGAPEWYRLLQAFLRFAPRAVVAGHATCRSSLARMRLRQLALPSADLAICRVAAPSVEREWLSTSAPRRVGHRNANGPYQARD